MLQLLHDPTIPFVEFSLGAAFIGLLGFCAVAAWISRVRKRDINRPETFKRELYAEDDIEEIVVDGELPIPLPYVAPKAVTPFRVALAACFLATTVIGGWLGIRSLRIIRYWEAGDLCITEKNFSGAELAYRSAEQIDPAARKSHRLVADALLKQQELVKAIPELESAAMGDRKDPEIHVLLGDTLQSLERYGEAEKEYRNAIAIAPKIANPYVRLGSCLVKMNRIGDAIKEFRFATTVDPKDAAAHTNLGSVLLMTGDVDGAIQQLTRSVELAPLDVGVRNTLGTTYGRIKMYAEAAGVFRTELSIDPQFTIGYFNLGSTLEKLEDYEGAEDAFASYLKNTLSLSQSAQSADAKAGVPAAFEELHKVQLLHSKQLHGGSKRNSAR